MSALAAELSVKAPASPSGVQAFSAPGRDSHGSASAAMSAAHRTLATWLQRCLREGAYRTHVKALEALPLSAIESQLQEALGAGGEDGVEDTRSELLAQLRQLAHLSSRLAARGGSDAQRQRTYDTLVIAGLDALQHMAELGVEWTAQRASIDPLTGLPGRGALQRRLIAEHARLRRHGGSSTLMLLDLDRFKPINDVYGHLAGDRFLRAFSSELRGVLRPYDGAFRYGGDEFIVLLPQTSLHEGASVLARLRARLAAQPMLQTQRGPIHAAFSAGCALLEPARSVVQTIGDADRQLYVAKAGASPDAVS